MGRVRHAASAIGAALTAAALLAGPPYAIVRFIGSPLPSGWTGLTHGNLDDQALIGLMSIVVWAAWAQTAFCILLEAATGIRGAGLPRRPALTFGFQQDLARTLLAPILGIVVGAGTVTVHPGPAVAAPISGPPVPGPPVASADPHAAAPSSPGGGPHTTASTSPAQRGQRIYTVQPPHGRSYDSLWRIATTHLGNGQRWKEIFALNHGRLMPDGHRLTTPALILPGWPLVMPADATGLDQPTTGSTDQQPTTREITVAPGDTLSQIAADQYGDSTEYPRILAANKGRHEPDGRTVSDPDLIYPGWRLTIPDPTRTAQPPTTSPRRPADRPQSTPPASTSPPPTTAPPATPRTGAPPASDVPTTPSPPTTPAPPVSVARSEVDHNSPSALRAVFVGAGGLLAAGILGALVMLRRRRFRFRRPGRTIAGTPPELRLAHKAVITDGGPAVADVEFLGHALRSLVAAASDSSLPDVVAARLVGDRLDLRVANPHPAGPPAPWTADESGYWWSVSRNDDLPVHADNAADFLAPYPTLVGVGHTAEGERWLLDLEHLATATLTGSADNCLNLARFIAAELAVNAWSDHVSITLVGFGAELVELNPARLRHTDHLDQAVHALATGLAEAHDAQADVLADRADPHASEAWIPQVLLIAPRATADTAPLSQLLAALDGQTRRTAVAVVLIDDADQSQHTGGGRLVLTSDGHLTIPDLGVELLAQQLPADQASGLAALVRHARDTTDQPMPAATGNRPTERYGDAAGALRPEHAVPRRPATPPAVTVDQPTTPTAQADPPAESVLPEPDADYLERAATTTEDLATLAPWISSDVRRDVEAADPGLDADLAAWHDPDCPLPRLTLLGPVRLRAHGDRDQVTRRIGYYTEIIAYLATRPHGATAEQLADTFNIKPGRVRTDVYLARKWLGTNPRTGRPHLPNAPHAQPDRGIGVYQIQDILIDADLFRRLRLRGQTRGPTGIADLQAALELVTGPPLDQLRPGGYTWLADTPLDQYYIPAIIDVAHILTTHYLAEGDTTRAHAATEAALLAAPYEEIPRLDLAAIHHAEGNPNHAAQVVRDQICNRTDNGAPEDLPPRSADIIRRHQWLSQAPGNPTKVNED